MPCTHLTIRYPRLALIGTVLLCLIGCSKPGVSKPSQREPATAAMMSVAARTDAAKLAAQHPTFKLLLQKTDMPAILVAPEGTTDFELKSLLWYLRSEVQAKHFSTLGIKPTVTSLGTPVYTSGVINIYRGEKCAREMYIASGPDPCGASIHKAASYHWGDGGSFTADSGSISSANGSEDFVFTSDDNWQTDDAAKADPEGRLRQAAHARVQYSTTQNAKQSKSHSDVRFAVDDPDTQLRLSSYQFAAADAQRVFVNQFTTLESDHLCSLGFHTLQLSYRGASANTYPVQCAANK